MFANKQRERSQSKSESSQDAEQKDAGEEKGGASTDQPTTFPERKSSQDEGLQTSGELLPKSPSGLKGTFRLDPVWLVDYDELVIADRISESPTARVFQGEYRGQEVAIKIFNPDMINVERLQQEFQMISAIRSPHVVVFYGLSLEPKLCVVMEYCAKGTLEEVLANEDLDEVFDWAKFFQLAKGLASAIALLHRWKPQIIHREIRPQNLLMTDDWQIKFCDFGRARYNDKGDKLKTQTLDSGIENVAYTAPEVYMDGVYSQKTDVYSVGIVLWEIAMRILTGSHQKPFHELVQEGLNSFQILRKTCMQGVRPPLPDTMPAPVAALLGQCWNLDADKRPTAQDLLKELQTVQNEWKKAPKGSWKVVVRTEENDDSDSDEPVTPRAPRAEDGPAVVATHAPLPDEKAREDEIRLEVEKQVQERLKAEEERLKNALKAQFEKTAAPAKSGAAVAEIDAKEVILVSQVGKGQFGEVWKGTLHGKEVAVKKLFLGDELEENILKDFRREVEVMITLRHPNITLLMGACTQPGNLMIIMEFLSGGSVADLLHGKRKRFLSFEQRMKMAKDASLGMNWLHRMNPPFLHLDLKPQNLLVDANLNVKVADFGLSQIKGREGADELGGSPFYMAPEVLLGRGATEKSDVYSFGICLWELYTREEPYKNMFEDEEELTMSVCDDGIRPKVPEDTPKTLKSLIEKCWASNPENRPSFQHILEQRIFEKINVEEAILDEKAAQFWSEFFSTEKKPLWLEFWACLIKFLKPKEILSERDPRLDYFKTALAEPIEEDISASDGRALGRSDTAKLEPASMRITRDNFNKFIQYFGPMEMNGMVDRLQAMVKSPYFHGDISKKKAQALLQKTKKAGTFLVRYSSRPGDFIITVVQFKHRKAEFEHHIVTVDRKTGQYILLIQPQGTTLNMAMDLDRLVVLNTNPPSYPTFDALINACKKTLNIPKTSRYLPYKGTDLPIPMPTETKASGGTQIGKKETTKKDGKDKTSSKKGLGK